MKKSLQSNAKTYYYFTLILYEILHYQLVCFQFLLSDMFWVRHLELYGWRSSETELFCAVKTILKTLYIFNEAEA